MTKMLIIDDYEAETFTAAWQEPKGNFPSKNWWIRKKRQRLFCKLAKTYDYRGWGKCDWCGRMRPTAAFTPNEGGSGCHTEKTCPFGYPNRWHNFIMPFEIWAWQVFSKHGIWRNNPKGAFLGWMGKPDQLREYRKKCPKHKPQPKGDRK